MGNATGRAGNCVSYRYISQIAGRQAPGSTLAGNVVEGDVTGVTDSLAESLPCANVELASIKVNTRSNPATIVTTIGALILDSLQSPHVCSNRSRMLF